MQWLSSSNSDPMSWLLEVDPANPGVHYLALTQLLDRPADDPEVAEARQAVMASGPVPPILVAQAAEGYWVERGPGYYPKYRGTVWQVIFLGSTPTTARSGPMWRRRAGPASGSRCAPCAC